MDEKINILMVDDQPSKLLTYKAILNDLGENLISAHSGMEALERLLKTDVGLVLMDVDMPGMDGFELAKVIHGHPRFQDTAILFISAVHMSTIDMLKGYEYGAVDYISVPIVPQLLRSKVRVFAELRRKSRELERLNRHIVTLQDEERKKIARELHDSVGQLLASISMNNGAIRAESHKLSPGAARCVVDNAGMVDEISKQIRTISYLLHPPLLDERGIASALRWYIDGFSQRSKIEVNLGLPSDPIRLSKDAELSVFRIVQECLTNIHRHSGSSTAEIRVMQDAEFLMVEVEDAGKGIPPEKRWTTSSNQSGVGLRGMRERLRQLGGTLEIQSSDEGTRVIATIPIQETRRTGNVGQEIV